MNPVDCEVFCVNGEYFADTFPLGNPDKRCVGKIHRTLGIFSQKFTDARQIAQAKRQQLISELPREKVSAKYSLWTRETSQFTGFMFGSVPRASLTSYILLVIHIGYQRPSIHSPKSSISGDHPSTVPLLSFHASPH